MITFAVMEATVPGASPARFPHGAPRLEAVDTRGGQVLLGPGADMFRDIPYRRTC
ncbi:hypothetical protein [Streptomyces sp. HUAS TT20]|uniref:hypothetical protein n=1 Tax=Streptomyces sp. HUAS TT20 TaxID=3447509 RepID=UPI0021DAE3A9|nr:hypothetical protein [Streptomyces sp. HUAS 15-9]UXY27194.1 hypothetical protein N8I87_11720 [Streptomyces sp. HUAS 15-9]